MNFNSAISIINSQLLSKDNSLMKLAVKRVVHDAYNRLRNDELEDYTYPVSNAYKFASHEYSQSIEDIKYYLMNHKSRLQPDQVELMETEIGFYRFLFEIAKKIEELIENSSQQEVIHFHEVEVFPFD
jgi:hypothetical protein